MQLPNLEVNGQLGNLSTTEYEYPSLQFTAN